MTNVKGLARTDGVPQPFTGYQQATGYWYKATADERGEPVTRIRPRALLIPPGFPDFLTRARTVERGLVSLAGRAWSGLAPIARVEVSIGSPGSDAWHDATLGASMGRFAWSAWSFAWDATPGPH